MWQRGRRHRTLQHLRCRPQAYCEVVPQYTLSRDEELEAFISADVVEKHIMPAEQQLSRECDRSGLYI